VSTIGQERPSAPEEEITTFDARKRHRGAFWSGGPRLSRRVRPRGKVSVALAATWVIIVLLLAITANWLPIKNPIAPIGPSNANPHWGSEFLGLDVVGRSMISRMIYGARASYIIAICATVISLLIGAAIALLAVYYRGVIGFVSNVLCTVILSIPGLLLLLTIAVAIKPSYPEIIGALALLELPRFVRVIQGIANSEIEKPYIVSARGMGASGNRIIVRELLPSTLVSVVTYAGLVIPTVMLTEGSMSYLGYGVPAPAASWGEMIALGQQDIATNPWQVLIPAIVFAVNIYALFVLTDWFRIKVGLRDINTTI
jgi:peptide/nickel transport system permease protein